MNVNGKDYPIYEMENKIHVWNHKPDSEFFTAYLPNWDLSDQPQPDHIILPSGYLTLLWNMAHVYIDDRNG